ncbi:MAG: DEAD/DEAH box helicase, partial [Methanosarcinales archaeon]|nr:DEAD/DEAH box helicase [Methanosarcinales archaeon]
MTDYVTHALIKPELVEQRLYQLALASFALEQSSLVVLPTGLGKTIVALMVMAARLKGQNAIDTSKVLLLAPTKPLVDQHAKFFKNALNLPEEQVVSFTGSITPAKRKDIWQNARVIISTPQVIENDVLSKRIDLSDVVHITFDEAHRATGNYAYTYIAKKYHQQAPNPRVLAITASPGSEDEKVAEVCTNLYIQAVKVKTERDADVTPYIFKKEIEWIKVDLPKELLDLKTQLEEIFNSQLDTLSEMGFKVRANVSKRELLAVSGRMQARLHTLEAGAMGHQDGENGVEHIHNPDAVGDIYQALSMHAQAVKIHHAIELIETQGAQSLWKYFDRMRHEARAKGSSKASRRLVEDIRVRKVMEGAYKCEVEHPKLAATTSAVTKELTGSPESRVIVFTQYRDTAKLVEEALNEQKGIRAVRFVGQANNFKDRGLNQKQQAETVEMFKAGEYNVLVATSVAEEGLDIPATDLVLFYEPVPSAIRSIQRKGRTGRKHEGRVVVLVTKKTRDEAFLHIS